MSVSVIVSNFNGARFLPRLLESLSAQRGVRAQVIVVDRRSTDRSREILWGHRDLTFVSEPAELGLAAGYAAGLRYARHEHLFFCNEDMWFDADCLASLQSCIDLNRRIAVADPWQWSYDGARQVHNAMGFERGWHRGSAHPLWRVQAKPAERGDLIPMPCAGAMMIHRAAYDDVGGWDTSFFLDYEDLDLAIRLWQRDWSCVTVPKAKVYHSVGASNAQRLPAGRSVGQKRYIYGSSNRLMIAVKYLDGAGIAWSLAGWVEHFVKNVLMLRLQFASWDLFALGLTLKRAWNRATSGSSSSSPVTDRTGSQFFADPRFAVRHP